MKAEEIRKVQRLENKLGFVSSPDGYQIFALFEIAVQLAELNERLAKWEHRCADSSGYATGYGVTAILEERPFDRERLVDKEVRSIRQGDRQGGSEGN